MAYFEKVCNHCDQQAKFTIIQVLNRLATCTGYYCQCNICLQGEVIIIENEIDNSPPTSYPKGYMEEDNSIPARKAQIPFN